MRGKGDEKEVEIHIRRITPAYAGKSNMEQRNKRILWDHPRVCGEKHCSDRAVLHRLGSPPRMRGKDGHQSESQPTHRITPAYAGKSSTSYRWKSGKRDHPRVCGEKPPPTRFFFPVMGSPPRMRGKVPQFANLGEQPGITPAYAGKRLFWPLSGFQFKDHPRVCGEKTGMSPYGMQKTGSPPRMRGKVPERRRRTTEPGITPAYAGKSSPYSPAQKNLKDHPRVCGEKMLTGNTTDEETGSPPRMRGKGPSLPVKDSA